MTSSFFDQSEPILVLGATGKTGSRVAQRLLALGHTVRFGSRTNSPPFDWHQPTSWPAACQGMKVVYLTFQPDLAVPQALDTIKSFIQVAQESGLSRVVLLSGRGEPEAAACEQVVIDSGVDWTILRASWFNQNFSEGHLLEAIQTGYLALPVANIGEPFIDADDIADVAVAALTQTHHCHQRYELTGPRLLSFPDAVAEMARQRGRPIDYKTISVADYQNQLQQQRMPVEYSQLLVYLFTQVLDGRNAKTTSDVARVLSRPPTDFRLYATRVAASGLWDKLPEGPDSLSTIH